MAHNLNIAADVDRNAAAITKGIVAEHAALPINRTFNEGVPSQSLFSPERPRL